MKRIIFLLTLLFALPLAATPYEVKVLGIDEELANELLSSSLLVTLQESPPSTRAGVKRRAESDIPRLVQKLHGRGYYNARVEIKYDFESTSNTINILIDKGVVYPLKDFSILAEKNSTLTFDFTELSLDQIGVELNEPATPSMIVNAEASLLKLMDNLSYPFAKITKREVIADQKDKTIQVILTVDSGPLAYFGPTTVTGSKRVLTPYFERKISWCEGELYSPEKLRCTQRSLESRGLFNSVSVEHAEALDENNHLPISIHVKERKPRSLGLGINYASQRGLGASGEWEHRNFFGEGETLSFRANVWYDLQDGRLSYLIPDFRRDNQDLIWLAEYRREATEGYIARSISLSSLIDRRYNKFLRFSYGLMYKNLLDSDIHENVCHPCQKRDEEEFHLAKIPVTLFWNQTDDLLDPSLGYTVGFKTIPSWNFIGEQFGYDINVLTLTGYHSIDEDKNFILAGKGTFGSIFGAPKATIPRSELFDAGTDELLRGYKYMTVSPLDNDGDPTGGRSMMIYSLELRVRLNKSFGLVGFYDFGNVYNSVFPDFNEKILNSVGVGVRYFTPVGPLRVDVAFPLNFRRHTDRSHYQFYLSIGESF